MLMTDHYWCELGRDAARQVKVPVVPLPYIEARGVLCANMPDHLGGRFWIDTGLCAKLLLKFKHLPVCRWYPPEGVRLELVGKYTGEDTRFYRVSGQDDPPTILEIAHRPMEYTWQLFKYPDLRQVLVPPFDINPSLTNDQRGVLLSRREMWREFCS